MTSSRSKGPVTQPPSPAGSWRRWARSRRWAITSSLRGWMSLSPRWNTAGCWRSRSGSSPMMRSQNPASGSFAAGKRTPAVPSAPLRSRNPDRRYNTPCRWSRSRRHGVLYSSGGCPRQNTKNPPDMRMNRLSGGFFSWFGSLTARSCRCSRH